MEQKSDVQYRAAKLYKNVRGKFGLLIREVVSGGGPQKLDNVLSSKSAYKRS